MTREEKCKLAIERGYTYNPETGLIYNRFGKTNVPNKIDGYIKIGMRNNNKYYCLLSHQFAWYYIYKECVKEIDHINGVRNDNRICNLRNVTRQQNQFNRIKAKGYSWNKKINKWHSRINVSGKQIFLGCYNTEEEARNAYLAAKEKYHVI